MTVVYEYKRERKQTVGLARKRVARRLRGRAARRTSKRVLTPRGGSMPPCRLSTSCRVNDSNLDLVSPYNLQAGRKRKRNTLSNS